MRALTTSIIALSLAGTIAGCGDDETASTRKAIVDRDALEDGVTVYLDGNIATVDVPFTEPLRDSIGTDELNDELEGAVQLAIESDETGTTADLSTGTFVAEDPNAPGEFTWDLGIDGDLLTFTFFNETLDGTTLKTDRTYSATMQVGFNDYIVDVSSFSTTLTIQTGQSPGSESGADGGTGGQ